MTIYAIYSTLGVSLVSARTPEAAVRKARLALGSDHGPFRMAPDQEMEVSWAKAWDARIIY